MAAVGRGELAAGRHSEGHGTRGRGLRARASARGRPRSHGEVEFGIPVRGAGRDQALKFSLGTGAVPGERIVGIRMPGEGIVIYPIFASALEQLRQRARTLDRSDLGPDD